MTDAADQPNSLSLIHKVAIGSFVLTIIAIVFGSLLGTVWFLPSPWYVLGAFPATAIYWLLQRDSVFETIVIFVILAILAVLIRPPIQHVRDYFESKTTTNTTSRLMYGLDYAQPMSLGRSLTGYTLLMTHAKSETKSHRGTIAGTGAGLAAFVGNGRSTFPAR